MISKNPVIFFDGVCNLCNASVQFVIEHDQKDLFKFTALQGDYAKETLPKFNADLEKLATILLLEDGKLYTKSSAALRVARKLNGLIPLLYTFIIVPKFMRDWVYDWIAKNRYKWWGKQESCWVPTPALKSKFLP
ncbi:Predicted thiol-disulfide oxidoreductase YuxK, DCC family [Pedobacter terrae]|uniref:Predicted thiol-disulfide oxidoreductase YuxK, DCC family n=1 Tax=Pedobacter terrae TaxID=405671 RepID=A0A1G8E3M7_9SPHI|nr:DCC1-like thiol-disulfide oxidoreductase family protein [Pedobacter terrae]SDH64455.1 Predicted thiol-disulfide oxidoreductase YuxK, DCC family [Pedobacter terrae]